MDDNSSDTDNNEQILQQCQQWKKLQQDQQWDESWDNLLESIHHDQQFLTEKEHDNIRPYAFDRNIKSSRRNMSSNISTSSRSTRSTTENDLVICIVHNFLDDKNKKECPKIMTQQLHIQHLNYKSNKDNCSNKIKQIKINNCNNPKFEYHAHMFRRKLSELKQLSDDKMEMIQNAVSNNRITNNRLLLDKYCTEIQNDNKTLINQTEGIEYLRSISTKRFLQITNTTDEGNDQNDSNQDNSHHSKIIRLSSNVSSQHSSTIITKSIMSSNTKQILSSEYNNEMIDNITDSSIGSISIKTNRDNGLTDFTYNMIYAFTQIYIPLYLKKEANQLPLHKILNICKHSKNLTREIILSEFDQSNGLTKEQIIDVKNFFQNNEVHQEILNSLQVAIMKNAHCNLHIFYWNKNILQPQLKKTSQDGFESFEDISHDSMNWHDYNSIFIINSNDAEFNKFTLYESKKVTLEEED